MVITHDSLVVAILSLSTVFVLFGLFFFYHVYTCMIRTKEMIDSTIDFMVRQDKMLIEVMNLFNNQEDIKHEGTNAD